MFALALTIGFVSLSDSAFALASSAIGLGMKKASAAGASLKNLNSIAKLCFIDTVMCEKDSAFPPRQLTAQTAYVDFRRIPIEKQNRDALEELLTLSLVCSNFREKFENPSLYRRRRNLDLFYEGSQSDLALIKACGDPVSYTHLDVYKRQARYSAAGKEYVYRIRNSRLRDPFENGRALLWPHPLDAAALDDAAQAFVGRHDFRSCMASGSKITDTVRRVFRFRVRREGELVTMTVAADGFLYNMVRIMAGTLLCPGVTAEKITRILDARERGQAGATAPAHGLYLSRVFYPDGLLTPPASTTPKGQATDGRFFHLPRAGEEIRPGEGQNPLEGSIL